MTIILSGTHMHEWFLLSWNVWLTIVITNKSNINQNMLYISSIFNNGSPQGEGAGTSPEYR